MLAFRHYQLFAERNCIRAAPPEAMMQLHKRMPDTLPKDWRLLPTGYFTHQLVGLPNPLDDAPESPDRIEAIEARLMLAGLEGRVRRVECGPAPRAAVRWLQRAPWCVRWMLSTEGQLKMPSAPFGRPDTTRPAAARAVFATSTMRPSARSGRKSAGEPSA